MVTVVARDGVQRRVEVRTGATGDGFVEVVPLSGTDPLDADDQVLTGIRRSGAAGAP